MVTWAPDRFGLASEPPLLAARVGAARMIGRHAGVPDLRAEIPQAQVIRIWFGLDLDGVLTLMDLLELVKLKCAVRSVSRKRRSEHGEVLEGCYIVTIHAYTTEAMPCVPCQERRTTNTSTVLVRCSRAGS